MGVYFGLPIEVSDMQGPCPDGFHVPLHSEWTTLAQMLSTLGIANGIYAKSYLKMPYAGARNYYTSNVQGLNERGSYISSSSLTSEDEYYLYIDTTTFKNRGTQIGTGCSIRPFANTPVTPDSSWTALYSDKIYHNSDLGLISISSDGNTRITIADKNLGATTVYNSGDALSESNCGNYYQRGNNYGFPFTGTVTTSSTQVNASTYGPGNYYESSTFITTNPRDNSGNLNLRGGVTQGTTTKSVELQNAYIGEYVEWKPGANTICYFPFTDNVDDSTGNYSLTRTNLTKGTIGYIFTQSGGNIHLSTDVQESTKFVGIWFKASSDTNTSKNMGFLGCNKLGGIQYWLGHTDTSTRYKIQTYTGSGWTLQTSTPWDTSLGNWHYLAYSLVGTTLYLCRNGTVSTVLTATPYDYGGDMALCNFGSGASCSIEVSDWIMEDVGWSSDAMTEYYNNTKSKYGRS